MVNKLSLCHGFWNNPYINWVGFHPLKKKTNKQPGSLFSLLHLALARLLALAMRSSFARAWNSSCHRWLLWCTSFSSWKNQQKPKGLYSSWWQLKDFFKIFTPKPWGNDPIWRACFSNGLKPPTSIWLKTTFATLEWFCEQLWTGQRMFSKRAFISFVCLLEYSTLSFYSVSYLYSDGLLSTWYSFSLSSLQHLIHSIYYWLVATQTCFPPYLGRSSNLTCAYFSGGLKGSKYLVTPIYKPFRPFGSGTTLLMGLSNHGY